MVKEVMSPLSISCSLQQQQMKNLYLALQKNHPYTLFHQFRRVNGHSYLLQTLVQILFICLAQMVIQLYQPKTSCLKFMIWRFPMPILEMPELVV